MIQIDTSARWVHRMVASVLAVVLHLVIAIVLSAVVLSRTRLSPTSSEHVVEIVIANNKTDPSIKFTQGSNKPIAGFENNATPASRDSPAEKVPPSEPIGAALHRESSISSEPQHASPKNDERRSADAYPVPRTSRPVIVDPDLDVAAIVAADRYRLAARQPRGPVGAVSLFGSEPAQGRSFVFLLDRSKSMGGRGLALLDAAEKELTRALNSLEQTHRFQIIAYHDQCKYLSNGKLLDVSEANKKLVPEFLGNMGAFGGTNHLQAISAAMALEPDVIFLLSDGAEPFLNDYEIEYLLRLAQGRTRVDCLQFGDPLITSNNFMRRLAGRMRGQYHQVK